MAVQQVPVLEPGLYVVATPIGNLADISQRALDVLRAADRIAAEDTRISRRLLDRYAIRGRLQSLHAHNEHSRSELLVEWMRAGEAVALISDAGSPLISDPGYPLVRATVAAGLPVVAVPGPCALVCALMVSGLPSARFCFEGFLPARGGERRKVLGALRDEIRTLVFYESSHRIADSLADCRDVLGGQREAALARELTKRHETVLRGTLAEIAERVASDADQRKGEFVLMIAPPATAPAAGDADAERLLALLLAELPASRAAQVAAGYLGRPKRALYELALRLAAADRAGET